MKATRLIALLGALLLLGACTTVDTVTPEQRQLANLRAELNGSRSDVRSLMNQVEDLASRCQSLESENAALKSSLREVANQTSSAQQGLRQLSQTSSRTEDIAALNKAYQQMVSQLKSINESSLASQQKIDKNLQVIQKDAQTLQGYIQENRTKISSLESRVANAEQVAKQAASAAANAAANAARNTASTSVSRPVQQTSNIVRTGKPSSPNITYDSVYEHVVAKGESISMIAKDYGVTITDIYNVNPSLSSTSLQIGQKLRVPKRTDM